MKRKNEEYLKDVALRQVITRPRMKYEEQANKTMVQVPMVQLIKSSTKLNITSSVEQQEKLSRTHTSQASMTVTPNIEEGKIEESVSPVRTIYPSSRGRKSEFEVSNFNCYLGDGESDQKLS